MKRDLGLIAGGAMLGLSWGHAGAAWLFVVAGVMPLLWHQARTRWTAGAVALAYYLASSRGLPPGAGVFFDASAPGWFGWALWGGASAVNALLWFALWSRESARRTWLAPLILVLTSVPPFGLIGWTNPLTAAGQVFPGMGFIGLAFFVGLIVVTLRASWPAVAMFAAASVLANVCALAWPPAPAPALASWAGLDTHYPKLQSGPGDFLAEGQRVMFVMQLARGLDAGKVLVLPETLLPRLTPFTASMLADTSKTLQNKRSAILVGAELGAPGEPMRNVLAVLGAGQEQALVQRVPVPIGMWRPWQKEAVVANLAGNGIGHIAGQKIAYSICYEQLLVFPVLASMVHSPVAIVGAANDWWAKDTSVPAIQDQSIRSWGRLFSLPVILAKNI